MCRYSEVSASLFKETVNFPFYGFRRKRFGKVSFRLEGDYLLYTFPVHPAGQKDYRYICKILFGAEHFQYLVSTADRHFII